MVYDSITNASTIPWASNAKDLAKKKANRSAKLKQCKLDARREQWLSQVKKKGCKDELNTGGPVVHERNERDQTVENLVINHSNSELEWSSNSPTSHTSFSGSGSSISSSGGCCSECITEDDDCLDDWEALADALVATEHKQDHRHSPNVHENITHLESTNSKPVCVRSSRAWRPDDTFRPQSLPNLLKQHSFPTNSDRYWGCQNVISTPSSCPICCEDLDLTDSSFIPCSCGFRLCLFCHKRILEEDGRCPGCRKLYDSSAVEGEPTGDGGNMTLRLAGSCSMITRS